MLYYKQKSDEHLVNTKIKTKIKTKFIINATTMNNNKFTIDFGKTYTDFIIDLRTIDISQKNASNRHKLIIVGLISLMFITGVFFYVHTQAMADISTDNPVTTQTNFVTSVANSVKMTATVPGWFKTTQISNEQLDIATNMEVFVNGQKMIPVSKIVKTANHY